MSLVEDLMLEMQALKQVNSELKAEMERAKENVSTGVRSKEGQTERLTDIESGTRQMDIQIGKWKEG